MNDMKQKNQPCISIENLKKILHILIVDIISNRKLLRRKHLHIFTFRNNYKFESATLHFTAPYLIDCEPLHKPMIIWLLGLGAFWQVNI